MTIPTNFSAFRIHNDTSGYRGGIESLKLDDLNPGEVVIRSAWSSVNYKDALAGTGKGKILRQFPLVGGIDVAGHVVASADSAFKEGDAVLATGCGLSETRDGGYSQYVRLAANATIALPPTLSLRESMVLGTAGFTAGMALFKLLENRQTPAHGPLAITGATGGVGSIATSLFRQAGFEVHAISGKAGQVDYLKSLGATEVLAPEVLNTTRPLESTRFGGGLDTVGGNMLTSLLTQTAPYGNVVTVGMAASAQLEMTVMPFILRGVSLLGVGSAGTERNIREQVWQHLGSDWKPATLSALHVTEISLEQLPKTFETLLNGQALGRFIVRF